jgi:hypothetical protein
LEEISTGEITIRLKESIESEEIDNEDSPGQEDDRTHTLASANNRHELFETPSQPMDEISGLSDEIPGASI